MFALLYLNFLESLSCLFVSFLGFTFQSCCCRIITHCWFVFYLRINVIIFVCVLCNCDSIASSLFFGFCEHGEGRLNNNDACWGMHWNTEFCGVNAWEGVLRKYSVLIRTSKLLFLVWTLFCFIFVAFLVLSSLSFHDGNLYFFWLNFLTLVLFLFISILELVQQVVVESLGWFQWNSILFPYLSVDDHTAAGGSCEILFL